MSIEKIRPHHLERKAILYVRQSSAHQVLHNRESGTLQYAVRDRLVALCRSTIETVDDDLGRSVCGWRRPCRVRTDGGRSLPRQGRGLGKPDVFNFLGFTHICGRSQKGRFQLRRQSRRDRLRRKLREIRETLWQHRHGRSRNRAVGCDLS
jgi:hypothetical protein